MALRWATMPSARQATGRFLLLTCALPVLLALALHIVSGRDLWVPRYLTGFLPGLALLSALIVDAVPRPSRRVLAIAIALWWSVAGGFYFAGRWPKPDWTRIIAELAPEGRATLCTNGSFVALPLIFHARAQELHDVRVTSVLGCRVGAEPTWLVYDVERLGVAAAPRLPGLVLGPRIVLFRGMQNLDARRVISTGAATAR